MGYRSNVFIKVHHKDEDKLVDLLNKVELHEEFTKNMEDGNYVGYIGEDLKWYGSYPDVKAINDFINEESEHIRGLIAIGEDNDTTEEGSPSEIDMYTTVDIVW